jgi:hypothetical protein
LAPQCAPPGNHPSFGHGQHTREEGRRYGLLENRRQLPKSSRALGIAPALGRGAPVPPAYCERCPFACARGHFRSRVDGRLADPGLKARIPARPSRPKPKSASVEGSGALKGCSVNAVAPVAGSKVTRRQGLAAWMASACPLTTEQPRRELRNQVDPNFNPPLMGRLSWLEGEGEWMPRATITSADRGAPASTASSSKPSLAAATASGSSRQANTPAPTNLLQRRRSIVRIFAACSPDAPRAAHSRSDP